VDWICLAQFRDQCRACGYGNESLVSIKGGGGHLLSS
jgi:hypothetical protein